MTLRIALALLVIVPAAMAYPWQSNTDYWILGVAIAVVLIVFAWWRGLFVTTMIGRRLAVWRRNHSKPKVRPSTRATVLLLVDDPVGVGVPLSLIAGYTDRFGIRCDKVRVTSVDDGGARTTWIGVTLDAAANLAALQARSPELPLTETAEIVARRLADQLREAGLGATIVSEADAPLIEGGRETWSGVRDDAGTLSAYGVPVDDRFAERLSEVWAQPGETWTALEFSGTATRPTVAAACAFRTDAPRKGAPLAGLVVLSGLQRPRLAALDPRSVQRIGITPVPLPPGRLDQVRWHVESANSTLAEQTRL
ncbi:MULTISPECIES: type VII secretion protein EccE [unclassified Mycobacterium]|uniref:type VII secretion protein EccE n=1 Tax=unclassified Mycobacterium TaxID=2642494 RepID=UPI0029C6BD58|nr:MULTISPECIES: type VII secretion protein EccE [unclassified Mycobacterium]